MNTLAAENTVKVTCDMKHDCSNPVTHIGEKGYAYCAEHASLRRGYERCRRMRQWEINLLNSGKQLALSRVLSRRRPHDRTREEIAWSSSSSSVACTGRMTTQP